jgi:glycerophosphoryl diester phosphodiesterase
MSAFEKAVEIGADGIELDVHLSRDGRLVVCHDETVARTTDGSGAIGALDYDEIRKFDAGSWFAPEYRGQRVPLLDDVLTLARDRDMRVNVEMKTGQIAYRGIEAEVAKLVSRYDLGSRVIVSSFNHYSVLRLKECAPHLDAGLLYSCHIVDPHLYARALKVEAIHPVMHTVTPQIVSGAKDAGIKVNAWFEDERSDRTDIADNLQSRVDIIITNYPQHYVSGLAGQGMSGRSVSRGRGRRWRGTLRNPSQI